MLLIFGGLLGAVAVAMGAFIEHGLRGHISAEHWGLMMTGLRYHLVHAGVIVAIGVACTRGLDCGRLVLWSGGLLTLGIGLFSGSLYLTVLADQPGLVDVTPIGGTLLIIGWLGLALGGVMRLKPTP